MSPRFGLTRIWVVALCTIPDMAVSQAAPTTEVTAFVDVSVVPMDRERVLLHQTVVVRNGQVVALGPVDQVSVPAGATRVAGAGKFLLPGLADMHVHLPTEESPLAEAALFQALAHGVTTVRNMNGGPGDLALRERAARGVLLSPRIYTAGPMVFPAMVKTPADAIRSVESQRTTGYDFLKPYSETEEDHVAGTGWGPGVWDTLMAAAQRARFPVAGHVPYPDSLGVLRALTVPFRSMEHLHGYWRVVSGGKDTSWDSLGATVTDELIAATQRAGVWNTPTLTVALFGRDVPAKAKPVLSHLIRSLAKAPGLLLGTDTEACGMRKFGTPNKGPWQIGFATYQELRTLHAVGLTPYEALVTGTRNVATFWGTEDSSGTVAVGKRADLVLVNGNPLEDLESLVRPAGVMIRGRWLSRAALDTGLARWGLSETSGITCADFLRNDAPALRSVRLTVHPSAMVTAMNTAQAGVFPLDALPGSVYVPHGCVGTQRCPLVVILSGGGQGIGRRIADRDNMIVYEMHASQYRPAAIDTALGQIFARFAVDPQKLAIVGRCAGGEGAMELGGSNLEVFSRIVLVSPRGVRSRFDAPVATTEFFFEDGIDEPDATVDLARQLRRAGHRVTRALRLRGHEDQTEDYDALGHWLRESWAVPDPAARPAPQVVAEPVPVLTVDALSRLNAFWSRFQAIPDSIRATARQGFLRDVAVLVGQEPMSVQMTDMAAFAARYPAIAAALDAAGLTAQQHDAYRLALISARATQRTQGSGTPVEVTPTEAANMALMQAHPDELEALETMGIWKTP